jgi:hypothetical protein
MSELMAILNRVPPFRVEANAQSLGFGFVLPGELFRKTAARGSLSIKPSLSSSHVVT